MFARSHTQVYQWLSSVVGQFEMTRIYSASHSVASRPGWNHTTGMTTTRKKRPRDPVQLGKLIVDIATGQVDETPETPLVTRARTAGAKGGPARAARLTPEQRSEIAHIAAAARWKE